jgi:ribosomal protein S18 acetylase RimI-like enzyme
VRATKGFTLLDPAAEPRSIEPILKRILAAIPSSECGWGEAFTKTLRAQLAEAPARGRILLAPGGDPCGVVTWTALKDPALGSSLNVHVLDPHFDPEALGELLGSLGPTGLSVGSILRLSLWPPLRSPVAESAARLGPLGFRSRTRIDCRFDLARAGGLPPAGAVVPPRPLTVEDEGRIARLMEAAYADDPGERALFAQWRDPSAEARSGTHDLISGEVGTWRPDASFGIVQGGELAAATMVQEFHGFLLSEMMVGPAWRRRGFASALIGASVRALAKDAPNGSIRLVVTRENERAFRLYAKLGFEPDPTTEGVVWVRSDALTSPRRRGPDPPSAPGPTSGPLA